MDDEVEGDNETREYSDEYFNELKNKIASAYNIGNKAISEGRDPDVNIEALPAGDLAARVEGIVGPAGIANRIKKLGRDNLSQIINEILDGASMLPKGEKEKQMDQALRTSLAVLTEGVVAAPIEGISKVGINSNPVFSILVKDPIVFKSFHHVLEFHIAGFGKAERSEVDFNFFDMRFQG